MRGVKRISYVFDCLSRLLVSRKVPRWADGKANEEVPKLNLSNITERSA